MLTSLIGNSNSEIWGRKIPARNCSSDPGPIEDRFQHTFSFEDFVRDIASGARVFRVVGIDSFHGIGDFVHRSK